MLLVLVVLFSAQSTLCVKILGIFPTPSVSHQQVYQPIWKELSLRGHQVTVLTPNPIKDSTLTNLTEIEISSVYETFASADVVKKLSKDAYLFLYVLHAMEMLSVFTEAFILQSQDLIKNLDYNFDLLLVETLNPLIYGYGCRFKVPIVGVASSELLLHNHDAVGNPTHPLSLIRETGFYHRLGLALYNVAHRVLYHWYILPKNDKIAKKYFGDDCPYLGDVETNVSLILANTNPILHPVRPNVPAIVEMQMLHLKPEKSLPQDLQNVLDESSHGVVYFSLGSNVKSSDLSENSLKVIVSAFSELPYRVLWKWESDDFPEKPANVIVKKWFPQQDVLRHKNVKVFVTQGGVQSTEESLASGVPIVGMPFFVDQLFVVYNLVGLGVAAYVDHETMTKDELKSTIVEVAGNIKYKDKARELRNLLTDQPNNSLDNAVWWIEYVIRHKGAHHLRSPTIDVPWYQYYLLDVIAFILSIFGAFVYGMILLLKMIKGIFGRKQQKVKDM